ncbi:hypothetical protein HOLleu_19972 [Holothuria leucospilota]|uniref:Uncharacterized protein n=1 Tax=Holothuria leucospilota TaxID=206669 RepID=A0A9Q1H5D1_HOLLE|nr:hypothetical protein HOLleu_19972 [Holothuria leucospilota]
MSFIHGECSKLTLQMEKKEILERMFVCGNGWMASCICILTFPAATNDRPIQNKLACTRCANIIRCLHFKLYDVVLGREGDHISHNNKGQYRCKLFM